MKDKKYSFFAMLINCIRESRQTKKDLRQIKNIDNSIEAFQRIVNTIALGSAEVEVEVTLNNGGKILIRRTPLNETGYESFAQKVEKVRKARGV